MIKGNTTCPLGHECAAFKDGVITGKTKLPLKLVFSLIGIIVTGTVAVTTAFMSVKSDLSEIRTSLRNEWNASHQRIWTDRLQAANAKLTVPDPQRVIDDLRAVPQNFRPKNESDRNPLDVHD